MLLFYFYLYYISDAKYEKYKIFVVQTSYIPMIPSDKMLL